MNSKNGEARSRDRSAAELREEAERRAHMQDSQRDYGDETREL